MILPKTCDPRFHVWNKTWHAPYGRKRLKQYIPSSWECTIPALKLVGPFGVQPNSSSRIHEYPWAFYATHLERGMSAVDLGGGFSGFPFVLQKSGLKVTNVDPFLDYGPHKHYKVSPGRVIEAMNVAFRTSVDLIHGTIEQANFPSESMDRVYCISAIEHMPLDAIHCILREVKRILKPNGLFVLTIDLFLNLTPFSDRSSNEFGTNASVFDLVQDSGLSMITGKPQELYGFPAFNPREVLANLEQYFIAPNSYPVLSQAVVLSKAIP